MEKLEKSNDLKMKEEVDMTNEKKNPVTSERGSVHVNGSFFKLVRNRLKKQKGFMDLKILILIAVLILLVLIVFAWC